MLPHWKPSLIRNPETHLHQRQIRRRHVINHFISTVQMQSKNLRGESTVQITCPFSYTNHVQISTPQNQRFIKVLTTTAMASPSSSSAAAPDHLRLSADYLRHRDFVRCRHHALLAEQNNPTTQRILAVADVIYAAEHLRDDWASVLQLPQNQIDPKDGKLVKAQFEKLVGLLNPAENKFPYANEAFELVCNAWNAFVERESGETVTFWTVCPYCYCLFEYEKVYEGCCLRCENCMKGFDGVAVDVSEIVKSESEYPCCLNVFPMGYQEKTKERSDFVEVSDDDVGKKDGGGVGNALSGNRDSAVKDGEAAGNGGGVGNVALGKQNLEARDGGVGNVVSGNRDSEVKESGAAGNGAGVGNVASGNRDLEVRNVVARPMKNVKTVIRRWKK